MVGIKFEPCPLCGSGKRLDLSSEECYKHVMCNVDAPGSCVSIQCLDCNIALHEHTSEDYIPYKEMLERLAKRWNSIKR